MKNKVLLAAMALPMVFAACTQDELVDLNNPVNKGGDIKVALNVTKEGDITAESRANWNGAGLTWEPADKISMYWLGSSANATDAALTGKSNAIFKTENGTNFTSESLVYLGSNAIVYPANVSHYQEQQIVIEVSNSQNKETVESVPYISNELNIKAEKISANTPGYHQPVYAPMKMAANVVTLKLDVKNTAALEKYGFDITSVELQADNAFTKKSNLVLRSEAVEISGEFKNDNGTAVNTIDQSVWTIPASDGKVSTLTSEAITKNSDGTYDVRFVVLPTDATSLANAKIVVNTTCGTINIATKTAIEDGKTVIKEGGIVNENLEEDAEGRIVTIAKALEYFASSITMPKETAYADSDFQGEKVGRLIPRTITVDASKAELNNSKVYKSEDIIRYVNLYTDMKKVDAMNLVMSVKDVEEPTSWNALTKDAVDAVNAKNPATGAKKVTLTADETVNTIVLTTTGAVYDVPAYNGKELPLILSAGEWTMDDTFDANNKFNKLQNNGTLTINGTKKDNVQNTLIETIENNGTLNIGGNGTLFVNGKYTSTENSVLNVTAGQTLTFVENIIVRGLINGKINVAKNAEFSTALGIQVVTNATIDNYGTVAARGEHDGFYNAGVINMKDAFATAYIQDNENGVIYLMNREDDVKVYNANQGKIVYHYNTEGTLNVTTDDRFNYLVIGDVNALTLSNNSTMKGLYKSISFEFTGSTTFETLKNEKAEALEIKDFVINEGATVKIGVDRTLVAEDIVLNGTLSVGGTVWYRGTLVKTVEPLTPGAGAINPYTGSVILNFDEANGLINNAAGLIEFANKVNAGTNYSGKTITLTADIDLAGIEWTPIGNTQEKAFRGTFNGNNKTIKNLTVSGTNGVGLFGYVDWNKTVGNSTIQNVKIHNAVVNGNHQVGALVGWAQSVEINDCEVTFSSINCINPAGGEDGDKAGALVGYFSTSVNGGSMPFLTNAKAENCVVSAGRDAGQIVGAARETQVTGTATNVTVKNNGTATGANIREAIVGRNI